MLTPLQFPVLQEHQEAEGVGSASQAARRLKVGARLRAPHPPLSSRE